MSNTKSIRQIAHEFRQATHDIIDIANGKDSISRTAAKQYVSDAYDTFMAQGINMDTMQFATASNILMNTLVLNGALSVGDKNVSAYGTAVLTALSDSGHYLEMKQYGKKPDIEKSKIQFGTASLRL